MEVLKVKTGEVEGVFLVAQASLVAERERGYVLAILGVACD